MSLVDAAYADITDAARLEAQCKNKSLGRGSCGSGPSGLDLTNRNERRQNLRADGYVAEILDSSNVSDNENEGEEIPSTIYDERKT